MARFHARGETPGPVALTCLRPGYSFGGAIPNEGVSFDLNLHGNGGGTLYLAGSISFADIPSNRRIVTFPHTLPYVPVYRCLMTDFTMIGGAPVGGGRISIYMFPEVRAFNNRLEIAAPFHESTATNIFVYYFVFLARSS